MTKLDWKVVAVALALFMLTSSASAQWDASTQDATSMTTGPMVSEPPAAQQPPKKGLEVGFTWSIGIGVPIVLDVPRDVVRPGANVFFFGGADFGYFVLGGDIGLQWNPIDLDNVAGFSGRQPLTRIYLSLPEVRFQVPDLKVVLPYVSGAFDINFWNFAETTVACGYWYCSNVSVYRFTPGFTGKGGLAFNVKESGVHIDVAFQYSFTGKGNFFEESGWWLAPVIGVLVRSR